MLKKIFGDSLGRLAGFGVITLIFVISISFTSCSDSIEEPVSGESYYFDTICSIKIFAMKDGGREEATKVIDDGFKYCVKYEDMLSKTKRGSDIYRINHADGRPVKCKAETIEVLNAGLKYCEMTDGRFDITIGKAEDLYDFHKEKHRIPKEKERLEAISHVGYENIKIKGDKVWLTDPEAEIDLGGVGKGFIADKLTRYLEEHGVESAIISLGGNIVCIGDKAGKDFNVGIEKPFSNQSEIVGATATSNSTLVTSGVYERYFEKDDKIYHHIIDPETGLPVDTDVIGITIISKKGRSTDCDCLSTICLLLGKEEGIQFMKKQKDCEYLFIDKDNRITKSKGMNFDKK